MSYLLSGSFKGVLNNSLSEVINFSLFAENYNLNYGEINPVIPESGLVVNRVRYKKKSISSLNIIEIGGLDTFDTINYYNQLGDGVDDSFLDWQVFDTVSYSQTDILPVVPCSVTFSNDLVSGHSETTIIIEILYLPRKASNSGFPEWAKYCLADINLTLRKMDKILGHLYSKVVRKGVLSNLLSLLDWTSLFTGSFWGAKAQQEEGDGEQFAIAVREAAQLSIGGFDLIIDAVDANVEMIEDYIERPKIDRIDKFCSDGRILNKVLGQALNYNVDSELSEYPVVARKDSEYIDITDGELFPHEHYDFSKMFQLPTCPQDTTNKFYLSEEIKNLLNVNFFNGRAF